MIGEIVSHFKILGKIGGGGMGVVFQAEDTKLKRLVALKFLPPDLTRDDEAKERFVNEAGSLHWSGRPEVNQFNYVTRVKTPTLMINGKYDTVVRYETLTKPMFDLLGTPDEHKELKLYETDHVPPKNDTIKETLAWLDRYLGPVK